MSRQILTQLNNYICIVLIVLHKIIIRVFIISFFFFLFNIYGNVLFILLQTVENQWSMYLQLHDKNKLNK